MPKDYYHILQVDPAAEAEVIEAAYKRLALKYHPDHNRSRDAHLRMQELNEAYAALGDPVKRAAYDRLRSFRSTQSETGQRRSTRTRDERPSPTDRRSRRTVVSYSSVAGAGLLLFICIGGLILAMDSSSDSIAVTPSRTPRPTRTPTQSRPTTKPEPTRTRGVPPRNTPKPTEAANIVVDCSRIAVHGYEEAWWTDVVHVGEEITITGQVAAVSGRRIAAWVGWDRNMQLDLEPNVDLDPAIKTTAIIQAHGVYQGNMVMRVERTSDLARCSRF